MTYLSQLTTGTFFVMLGSRVHSTVASLVYFQQLDASQGKLLKQNIFLPFSSYYFKMTAQYN